ncbi:GGDEF domain-containing protein [Peterkaempfera bronchialis]|uniref:GGDEF domain-containing protein n=1 Tax=Peterkaempfera bronchialis TaxID=2126346 RepID=A0A345SRN1_9ACTN|nr:GGDEF domain-containing protein [Peterkaempfera bronchialis]AXI76386.1 GGDEF domain-containing protein [Peterkaempfera bronchialis]
MEKRSAVVALPGPRAAARSVRRPPAWVRWLAVGGPAVAGYLALPAGVAADAVYGLLGVACTVAVVCGVRLHRPAARAPWYLLAAGQLLWTCGDVAYGMYEDVLHRAPFPSLADVLYIGAYPVLATALHLLTRRRGPGGDRAGLLDGALIATGLGLLSWVFLMRPAADARSGLLTQLMSLAYPVADLMALAMVLRMLVATRMRTPCCWLLAASLLLLVLTDSVAASLAVATHGHLHVLDAGWLLSYLLWAAAALHPSMRTLPEAAACRPAKPSRCRLAVLATTTLLAPGVLFAQGVSGTDRIDWLAVSLASAVLFLLVVVRVWDLTAQLRVQEHRLAELAELAGTDGLTGIPNRRTWDVEVARELADADRTGAPVCVALLDLDRFKRFNDAHGHLAGDHLLRSAAAAWQRQLRAGDLLARYGGEEFGVLVVGLGAERAAAVVDRLRLHTPLEQTLSAGVALWDGTESPQALLGRADRALYRAKSSGRNRVVVAAEEG